MITLLQLAACSFLSVLTPQEEPARIAVRLGLGADACATAGLTATETTSLLQRISEADCSAIDSLTAQVDSLITTAGDIDAGLREEPTNEDLEAQKVEVTSNLADAQASLRSAKESVWAAAVDGLTADKVTALERIAASSRYRLCAHYRVTQLTGVEARSLSRVVDCDSVSPDAPSDIASFVASIESREEVAAARLARLQNLVAVREAFDEFVPE